MLSFNQAIKKANKLEKDVEKILSKIGITGHASNIEGEILGLHEAATKLGTSVMLKKGQKEINKKVASCLIGVMLLADKLGVKNLEKDYLDRIEEIKKDNKESVKNK